MALTELSRFLPRTNHHNRYLRAGMRSHHHDEIQTAHLADSASPGHSGDITDRPIEEASKPHDPSAPEG